MTATTLVCGMHRSGTSLVAASLEACGLYLGQEHELIAAAPDNPRGFWEHERVASINDRLLAALGGGWDAPPSLPESWWRLDALGGLRDEARTLIEDLGQVSPWGAKDPRFSLVLGFWLDLIDDAQVVVCIRNPLEVVASLQARNGCSPAHALRLWWRYHHEIERAASSFPETPIIATHYRAHLDDSTAEIERLCTELRLDPGGATLASERMDRGLFHHRFDAADLLSAQCSSAVIETYARWCELAKFDEQPPGRLGSVLHSNTGSREGIPRSEAGGDGIGDAAPDAVGRTDLHQLALVDLHARFHLRGGHIEILERQLSEAAQRIVELETALTANVTTTNNVANETTHGAALSALADRLDDLSLRLDAWAKPSLPTSDRADLDEPATTEVTTATVDRTEAHLGWRRCIETATAEGSRVGVITEIADPPRNRHLNVVSGSLSPDALRLWAANGLDAIAVPPPDLVDPTRLGLARSSMEQLGWSLLADDVGGTVWSTNAHPGLATRLSDLCDDVELRTGRPASVLDATSRGLEVELGERALFRPGNASSFLPATVDIVIRDADRPELDATSRDLCITLLDGDELGVTRQDGRGRIPTVSVLLCGSHERFVRHVVGGLPSWWTGEVLSDCTDLTVHPGDPIRVLNDLPDDPFRHMEAMLDAARGEVLIMVIGRRLPARGAIAALLDAVLHDPSDRVVDVAYGRCVTTEQEPFPLREAGRWARPQGTRWTTRHRTDAVASPVLAIRREFWTHRDPSEHGRSAVTSTSLTTAEPWHPELGAALDGWLATVHSGPGAVWVADSVWTAEPDLPLGTAATNATATAHAVGQDAYSGVAP